MFIPLKYRCVAALAYFLPWAKTIPLGLDFFNQYPILQILIIPTLPIIFVENLIPFGSLIIFLILFLGVTKNTNVPYFIRFNTLQSILLNILLIIIKFGIQILVVPFSNGAILINISNCILILILSIITFSIYKCLKGEEADLPLISNAVRMQL